MNTPLKSLADLDTEAARVFAKRKGSWVPADWSTASHAFTGGPLHSWDVEDAEAPAPVVAPAQAKAA